MKKMLLYIEWETGKKVAINTQDVNSMSENPDSMEGGTSIWLEDSEDPVFAKDDIVDLVNRFNEWTR
jgi:hypothetical protein